MQHSVTNNHVDTPSRSFRAKRLLRNRRSALSLTAIVLALACDAVVGWLDEPMYEAAAPAEVPSGAVQGLVLLVSFDDEQISDEQAQRIWRRLNERGYPNGESGVSETGSLRDYFAEMSSLDGSNAPRLDLTSDVVHVRLPGSINDYDRDTADSFNVPRSLSTKTKTLSIITAPGPATSLLEAASCRLTGCNNTTIGYDFVTGTSVSPRSAAYSFQDLTTRTFSFWPDAYLRENFRQPNMGRDFSIPKIETFAYLGIIYAGAPSHGHMRGLWPRSVATPGTVIGDADVETRAARFFIMGTHGSASTPLGTLAHESAHTLFDFPDLYDGGEELGIFTSDPHSAGIGSHALLGSSSLGTDLGTWERPQNMSAPMRDRLGWANIIDLNDMPAGARVELRANGADVARYCRQDSPTHECFYVESRHLGSPRSLNCTAQDCSIESPAEGLVIWHTENPKNSMDYVVNNHEQSTPNIHNQVVLVEAPGTTELLQPQATINYADHYFRAGHVDRFDSSTAASSRWWDGTPSGLNIKNISSPGSTMSFELGPRPMSRIFTDIDEHVQVQLDAAEIEVGSTTRLVTTGDAAWQYDVHIQERTGTPSNTRSLTGLSGRQEFSITGVEGDAHVEIVSYPASGNAAAGTARFHAFMAEGTQAATYAAEALEYTGMERLVRRNNSFVSVLPGRDVGWTPERPADVTVDVPEAGGRALWVAKARPGYMLRSVEAFRVGESVRQSVTSTGTGELTLSVDVTAAALEGEADFIILINAEPIPNLLCTDAQVEAWRADKVLNDVGDLVRFDDVVYSSNVPRNLLQTNFSQGSLLSNLVDTPETASTFWSPVAVCGEYRSTCSGLPQWQLEGNTLSSDFTGDVVFNGSRYSFVGGDLNQVPGAFESRQIRSGVETFADVDPAFSLESNRLFISPGESAWRLQGHCADPATAGRASVVTSGGIASVSSPQGVKAPRASEPLVVHDNTSAFTLTFALRPGYELETALVDGQVQAVSPNATSIAVPAASGNQPRVIELRTRPL